MNLELRIFKNENIKDCAKGRHIRFAVVDLERSELYPENFVCMLPLSCLTYGKAGSKFSELFGDKSVDLAKVILAKALKTENDSEIKAEIERRLELLNPKPPVQVICHACGKFFEAERSRFKQTLCKECKQKRYSNQ